MFDNIVRASSWCTALTVEVVEKVMLTEREFKTDHTCVQNSVLIS